MQLRHVRDVELAADHQQRALLGRDGVDHEPCAVGRTRLGARGAPLVASAGHRAGLGGTRGVLGGGG